ncbi:MAG: hypothetical protein ACYCO4_01080 [Sulfobacillus sp.]
MRLWHLLATALVAGSLAAAPLAGSTSASGSGSASLQTLAPTSSVTVQDTVATGLSVIWQNLLATFAGSATARAQLMFSFAKAQAQLASHDFATGQAAAAVVPMEIYLRDMAEGRTLLTQHTGAQAKAAVRAEEQASSAGQAMAAAANQTQGQNATMATLIAKAAGVPISAVLSLRAEGMGWATIAAHYHLSWASLIEAYAKTQSTAHSSGTASDSASAAASTASGHNSSSANGTASGGLSFGF